MNTNSLPRLACVVASILVTLGCVSHAASRLKPSVGLAFDTVPRSLRDMVADLRSTQVPVTLVTRPKSEGAASVWDDTAMRGLTHAEADQAECLIWWIAHFGGGSVWQENGAFFIIDGQGPGRPGWTRFRLDDKHVSSLNEAVEKELDKKLDMLPATKYTLVWVIELASDLQHLAFIVDPRLANLALIFDPQLAKSDIFRVEFPPWPAGETRTVRAVLQRTLKALGCRFEVKWGAVYIAPIDTKPAVTKP